MRSPHVPCLAFFVFGLSSTFAQVTVDTLAIGGPGAVGSAGGNPPTLSNGTLASASLGFLYDASTGHLLVVVANTSPVVEEVPNPLISRVFFNLPRAGAVTDMALVSQRGNGGATPAFDASFDFELDERPHSNRSAEFGAFSVCLKLRGPRGGIANSAARTFRARAGSWVNGPVAFLFRVAGPDFGNLNASAFARSVAADPSTGAFVNALVQFQGGGRGGRGRALIGNAPDCSPSAFLQGQPRLGRTLLFVMSGTPGCKGCLMLSPNPEPFLLGDLFVPMGMPMTELGGGLLQEPFRTFAVRVPQEPRLVDATLYYALALTDETRVQCSPRYEFTICR